VHRLGARLLALLLIAAVVSSGLGAPASVYAEEAQPWPGTAIWGEPLGGVAVDVAWSPEGLRLAVAVVGEEQLLVYKVDGEYYGNASLPGDPTSLAWDPRGIYIAVAGGSWLVLLDAYSLEPRVEARIEENITGIAWSPDGSYLAAVTDAGGLYIIDREGVIVDSDHKMFAPALTVDWRPGGWEIAVGDEQGYLYLFYFPYNQENPALARAYFYLDPWGEPIVSVEWSPDGQLLAAASPGMLRLYTLVEDRLLPAAEAGVGALGGMSWSPCSSRLAVPGGDQVYIVSRDGKVVFNVSMGVGERALASAWNPGDFARLAVAGSSLLEGPGMVQVLYSGAYYIVTASPPVERVCYMGTCGPSVSVSAGERPTYVVLEVTAETLEVSGYVTAGIILYLWPMPFDVGTIDAALAVTRPGYNVSVEGGAAAVSILRAEDATLTVIAGQASKNMTATVILLDPGTYTFRLTLPRPDDYLGPDTFLVQEFTRTLSPGELAFYNYTWFTLSNVTGRLLVDAEPEAVVRLVWPDTSAEAVIPGPTASFTVPTGEYTLEIALPRGPNVLVAKEDLLVKDAPIKVFPGEEVRARFKYLDVLGGLIVEGPAGAKVTIKGVTVNGLQITHTTVLEGTKAYYYAEPGEYTVTLRLEAPPNWLGPAAPEASMTVRVVQGRENTTNFFYNSEIVRFVQMLEQAVNLTIIVPEGYKVAVEYNDTIWQINTTAGGVYWVVVPEKRITVALIDPETGEVIDEKQVLATSRQVQVEFEAPQQTVAPPPQTTTQPPPPEEGRSKLILIPLILLPVIAGAAAYYILTKRAKTTL